MNLFTELKRRNVIRMAGLYLVAAWLITQVVGTVLPLFHAPEWLPQSVVVLLAIGLIPAMVFAWVFEMTPDGLRREVEVDPADSIASQTGRRLDRMIIAALLLALAYFGVDKFVLAPQRDAALIAVTTKATMQARARKQPDQSIAVLPLANAGDQGQQFFSDGLSESLIIALSQFPGLKVIGRNSAFQFRDSESDSVTIGRKLGVAHLLEGSVQHAGDAVRISLELIDTVDGSTLWSQRYDRPYVDLFKLQDEITNAVAAALEEKLQEGSALAHSDRPPSGNIEAYSAYLQGLKHWHDQDFDEVAEDMTKAVQLDPGYAVAWAHLSGSRSTVAAFWNEAPAVASEHMREARLAADKALQLAPGLGAAHAARAYLQFYDFDERGALAECRRAVQLAPDDGTVLNGCGYTLAGIGKLGEAIRLRERLLSIEPLYTVNYFQYARLLMVTGRLDEAEKYLRTDKEVAWPYPLERLNLAALRGDANAALEIARQASPHDRKLYMTLAAQVGPDRAAADQWLADLLADKAWVESFDDDGYDNRYKIAQVHALRGDAGQTLEWLERSLARNPSRAYFMLADPFLLRFRDDPRFVAFYKKLGLRPPSESEALSIDQIRAMNDKEAETVRPGAVPDRTGAVISSTDVRYDMRCATTHPACLQYVGTADLLSGDFDVARSMLQRLAATRNPSASGQAQALVEAPAGRADRHALALSLSKLAFNSALDQDSGNALEDHVVALTLMLLDEHTLARDYIEHIAGDLGNTMAWAIMLPAMDPIRGESRFDAVVKQLKATGPHFAKVRAGAS